MMRSLSAKGRAAARANVFGNDGFAARCQSGLRSECRNEIGVRRMERGIEAHIAKPVAKVILTKGFGQEAENFCS